MNTEKYEKTYIRIGFTIPQEGQWKSNYQYYAYANGKTPTELRKAVLDKIKYLENNGRIVKTIILITEASLSIIFSKEEYLSDNVKGKRE
jgi:ABC-type amino acid transport substrate-binding protein